MNWWKIGKLRIFIYKNTKSHACSTTEGNRTDSVHEHDEQLHGELMNIGGRAHFMHEGVRVDRDLNGACNSMLRAVRDSSLCGNAHV